MPNPTESNITITGVKSGKNNLGLYDDFLSFANSKGIDINTYGDLLKADPVIQDKLVQAWNARAKTPEEIKGLSSFYGGSTPPSIYNFQDLKNIFGQRVNTVRGIYSTDINQVPLTTAQKAAILSPEEANKFARAHPELNLYPQGSRNFTQPQTIPPGIANTYLYKQNPSQELLDYQNRLNMPYIPPIHKAGGGGINQGNGQLDEGGVQSGKGTAKSDSNPVELPGGTVIIPVKHSETAIKWRKELGLSNKPFNNKDHSLDPKIWTSKGEVIFTPEEANLAKSKGYNLDRLIEGDGTGHEFAEGAILKEQQVPANEQSTPLKDLYNEFNPKLNLAKNYSEFESTMRDEKSRKDFFNEFNGQLKLAKDYNEFENVLGLKKKEPLQSSSQSIPSQNSEIGSKESGSEIPSISKTEIPLPKVNASPDYQEIAPFIHTTEQKTAAEVRAQGGKPTFDNYVFSAVTYPWDQAMNAAKGVRAILNTPEKVLTDVVENRNKPVVQQLKAQAGDALDLFNGIGKTAFSVLSLTPIGAAVNAATSVLPEDFNKVLFSPATAIADKLGYKPKEGDLGEKALTFADLVGSLITMHVGGKVVEAEAGINKEMYNSVKEKLKNKEPLNAEEAKIIPPIIQNTTPEDLAKAVAEHKDKLSPQFSDENKVVDIIEKKKEGQDVTKDIAALPPDNKFGAVLGMAKEGQQADANIIGSLQKDYADVQNARMKTMPEHQTNPDVVSLVAEKTNLEKSKENVDDSFHPAIDAKIDAIKSKIEDITNPAKRIFNDIQNATTEKDLIASQEEMHKLKLTTPELIDEIDKQREIINKLKEKENGTIQKSSPGSVFQHPQERVGETGSERRRVEPVQQRTEPTPQGEPTRPRNEANSQTEEVKRDEFVANKTKELQALPDEEYVKQFIDEGNLNANNSNRDFGLRPDFRSLQTADIKKGIEDIKNNKNTAAAKNLKEQILKTKETGSIPMIEGTGGMTHTYDYPLGHFHEESPIKLTKTEEESRLKAYDDYFNTLTEEQKQQEYENSIGSNTEGIQNIKNITNSETRESEGEVPKEKIIEAHKQIDEHIKVAQQAYDKAQGERYDYIKEHGYPQGEDATFDKLVTAKVQAEDRLNQLKKAKENLLPLPPIEPPGEIKQAEDSGENKNATSTKNAVINAERLKEGKAPITKIESIDLDAIREKVKNHLNDPETYRSADKNINPHILAQWSKDNPHAPISAWQEALLGGERDKLQTERETAHNIAEQAKQEGDMAKFLAHKDIVLEKQNLIDINDAANSYRGTEWSNIGRQRQQMIKNDYSPDGLLKKYQVANNYEPIPAHIEKQLREASQKITELEKQLSDKENSISEQQDIVRKKTIKEASREISAIIRRGKLSRPGMFSAATPASLVWDGALEIMAKTVDAGGTVAQAIVDGLNHIKNSTWYQSISSEKQKQAEKEYDSFINKQDSKIKAAETRLTNRLSKLEEQNRSGDYSKKERKIITSPAIEQLKNKIADAKKIANRVIQERFLKDRIWYRKFFDFIADFQHLGLITSPKAVLKVFGSAVVQPIRNTVEDVFSIALGLHPGLRITPTFKGHSEAYIKSISTRWTSLTDSDMWKDSWNSFLGKTTEMERLAGEEKEDKSPYWSSQFDVIRKVLYSSGIGIHKALKAPAIKSEYRAQLEKWNHASLLNGEDITAPDIIDRNKNMALTKALSVAFMQNAVVATKWSLLMTKIGEKETSFPVELGKFTLKTLNPIVKLPANFTRDVAELELGLVQALGQSIQQILPEKFAGKGVGGGWDKMTPKDKQLLTKRILKGSAGVALTAWGWYNYAGSGSNVTFAGYYNTKEEDRLLETNPEEAHKRGILPVGSIKIGDTIIGENVVTKLLMNNPIFLIPQLSATTHKVMEAKHRTGTDIGGMALGKTATVALSEVPFLENTSRTVQAIKSNPKKVVAKYGESFIPTIARQIYAYATNQEEKDKKEKLDKELESRNEPKIHKTHQEKKEAKIIKREHEKELKKEAEASGIEYHKK